MVCTAPRSCFQLCIGGGWPTQCVWAVLMAVEEEEWADGAGNNAEVA